MEFRKVRSSIGVFAVAAFVLASCGGDDDDNAAGATNEQAASADTASDSATASATADDNGAATADSSDDVVTVNDLGDIPDECVDLLGDYLKKLEPFVKDVDWSSATLDTMQQLNDQMSSEFSSMDDQMSSSGCDQYDFINNEDAM